MSKSTTTILEINSFSSPPQKITPNLLPCSIKHSGSIGPVSTSFWNPKISEDGKQVSFFRGRKLKGKTIKLPEGYKGVVGSVEESKEEEEDVVIDLDKEGGKLKVEGEFEEVVVWGMTEEVEGDDDVYVRGVEEWIEMSGRIHSFGEGK
ncbi:ribonuclease H2 non-catalytic subunit-domain-containing protein [Podospora fimiseda]|uniref:Ribonuclease H2 non-catalytic subunit-domain-containing protein n=1 Tax=Podospora fimiseda TaxID=252190 RepID=A0AAN7H3G0_9PEZI|nr:ribonuclease H2 non-catalytic subunit-domain-containing protein [Podospora fimiseda]